MAEIFLGVDCGTQGLKCLALDGRTGAVLAGASRKYDVLPGLPPGHSEQDPAVWIEALEGALGEVLARVERGAVRALAVSGQQHGFVPLDGEGRVIRPAKLWNDTSTAGECREILERLGGRERFLALTGNGLPPGFTASKILWLKKHEPENYARLAAVLLPHDYLNFYLTGTLAMEPGDASGTALMDIRTGSWAQEVLDAIDPALAEKLPPLLEPGSFVGEVLPEKAELLGLPAGVKVATGGGDNMMGALGTGNVLPGRVTASLGTSGTIYAFSETPVVDPRGEIAAFRDSTGGFLPLGCTMNVTVTTELARGLLGMDHAALEEAARSVPPGAGGVLVLPWFTGERTPDLPGARGAVLGLRPDNFTPSHLARAALEGATLGLGYVLERMKSLGIEPAEIRLTGGGSRSALWREICAGVFGVPVVRPVEEEGAALGAALQALWAFRGGKRKDLPALADRIVRLDPSTRVEPDPSWKEAYGARKEEFTLWVEKLGPFYK